MNAGGESDEHAAPAKLSNKEEQSFAEGVEGSCSAKRNTGETYTYRTQGRERVSQGLDGVREAARRDGKQKFTALLHHVTVELLRDSYQALRKQAAPGVDGGVSEEGGEGDADWDAARGGDIAATGEHLPALCLRSLGEPVAALRR